MSITKPMYLPFYGFSFIVSALNQELNSFRSERIISNSIQCENCFIIFKNIHKYMYQNIA